MKKVKNALFDVTMGPDDAAKVCESLGFTYLENYQNH